MTTLIGSILLIISGVTEWHVYCETLSIRGVKFSRYFENDKFAHFNFGVHDIPWLKIVKKI